MNAFLPIQILALVCVAFTSPLQSQEVNRTVLPPERPAFGGRVGETYKESTPDFSPCIATGGTEGCAERPGDRLDDVGFGQLGCYGGPIETPNIDRLAESGLRYTNFHTTAALFSLSSRVADRPQPSLDLPSRDHGSGNRLSQQLWQHPQERATISEVLKQNGYNTLAFGSGTWLPTPLTRRPGRLIVGHSAWDLNAITDSWAARPTNGLPC